MVYITTNGRGVLVDGVIVEKDKGRRVFEAIVQKGVDPGLVEKVKGNSFKTRVFPMPSKGGRTIKVSYVSKLAFSDTGSTYRLPLTFDRAVDNFSLRVEVVNPISVPKIAATGLSNFKFEEWHSGFFAETSAMDVSLNKDLHKILS